MTTKKTERIWMSPWTAHGFKESRLGIELNRQSRTILVWVQDRRFFLKPKIVKYVKSISGGRIPYARKIDLDLFDEEPAYKSLEHLHYGAMDKHIKSFIRLKQTEPYGSTAPSFDEWRNQLLDLVDAGVVWCRRTKPLLAMVVSFKKRLPALYQALPQKKRSRKLKLSNRTWSAESLMTQYAMHADAQEIAKYICRAATTLTGRNCNDLVDVLRPSIKERIRVSNYKMEWYPQFVRSAFNETSVVEGVAKIAGNRGKKTRKLTLNLLAQIQDKRVHIAYVPLYFVYLGRRILSAENIQKVLMRNDWDHNDDYALRGSYNTKDTPMLRRRLKLAPPEFRASWLLSFKNVQYCIDTLDTLDQIVNGEIELDWSEVPRNGNEAHDYLSKVLTRKKKEGMYKYVLKISKKFEQLHGNVVSLGNMKATFRLPENKGEIYEWGDEQHHCIASYADRHASGECVLLEVVVDDQKFHMQLERNQIRQFYGKYNKPPSPEIDKAVRDYLRKEKFVTS